MKPENVGKSNDLSRLTLGSFSVNNPVFLNILMFSILLVGGFSVFQMPRKQYPDIDFYYVNIVVPWFGVSPSEIERQVTIPIEEKMEDLSDLKEIVSMSMEGFSNIFIRFDDGIKKDSFDKLYQEVNTRFSEIVLPDETGDALVNTFSLDDFVPVIEIILSGYVGYEEMLNTAERLITSLKTIPDVSDAVVRGEKGKRILISTDRAAMTARNISLENLVSVLKSRNVNIPGGTLSTLDRNYLVRTLGELKEPVDFGDVILRSAGNVGGISRSTVKVQDVAQVEVEYDPEGPISRWNGVPAINIQVTKVRDGDSISIMRDIRSKMDELVPRVVPQDISVDYLNDSGLSIRDSINVMLRNFGFGLVLLVFILYIFMGLRNALLTALGIPVAFAITFITLDLIDETMNSNTLFALVLVLGLIVDHAIVITENSYRLQNDGMTSRDAAIMGVNQVTVPVMAATGTTVAAFLPLMLLPGVIGKFLRVVPLTVSIALIASTVEALIFLPCHYGEWPQGRQKKESKNRFKVFQDWFGRLLGSLYDFRGRVITFTFLGSVAIIAGIAFSGTIVSSLFDAEDYSHFLIRISMQPGTRLEKTDSLVRRYEERLLPMVGNGEITGVNSTIGFNSATIGLIEEEVVADDEVNPGLAEIYVDVAELNERPGRRSVDEIIEDVRALTADIPGADTIQFKKNETGPPTDSSILFRVFGDNYEEMLEIGDMIREELSLESGISNVRDNYSMGSPELVINPREDVATSYGLSAASLGRFINASIDGVKATTFFRNNKSLDVLVRFSDSVDFSPARMQQILIPTPSGLSVPLSTVATVTSGRAFPSITRLDSRRELTIEADSEDKLLVQAVNGRIRDIFEQEYAQRYPNLKLSLEGEFSEFNDLLLEIMKLFSVGMFLIYIILGAQFKSYLQPLLVLFAIPLGFVGILLFLFISSVPLSLTVIYAGVGLAGIAVNDSIVLISFINELRGKGMGVKDAVVLGAKLRLRPIILTSLTTIAGLLPTAIGLAGRSVVWGPMASTIVFGLLFSTIGTLLFVPLFYGSWQESIENRRKRRLEGAPGGSG